MSIQPIRTRLAYHSLSLHSPPLCSLPPEPCALTPANDGLPCNESAPAKTASALHPHKRSLTPTPSGKVSSPCNALSLLLEDRCLVVMVRRSFSAAVMLREKNVTNQWKGMERRSCIFGNREDLLICWRAQSHDEARLERRKRDVSRTRKFQPPVKISACGRRQGPDD